LKVKKLQENLKSKCNPDDMPPGVNKRRVIHSVLRITHHPSHHPAHLLLLLSLQMVIKEIMNLLDPGKEAFMVLILINLLTTPPHSH